MTYAAINMDVTASAMDLIFYAMKSKMMFKNNFSGILALDYFFIFGKTLFYVYVPYSPHFRLRFIMF